MSTQPSITVSRAALTSALALASKALPSTPRAPHEAVLTLLPEQDGGTQRLRLIGASYDMQIEVCLDAAWSGAQPLVVPGRLVSEWVKADRGENITASLDGDSVKLRGTRSLSVPVPKVDPVTRMGLQGGALPSALGVDALLLADALRRVAPATDTDFPPFSGVHLGIRAGSTLTLTATDRYVIGRIEMSAEQASSDFDAVPGHRALAGLVGQMGSATISLFRDEGALWVTSPNVTARIGLLMDAFPQLDRMLLQAQPNVTTVDAGALRDEVRAAAALLRLSGDPKKVGITLVGDGQEVHVTSRADEQSVHSSSAAIPADGDPIDVDLNPTYLLAALNAVGPVGKVTIHHHGPSIAKALLLDTEEGDGVGVVMPLQR